MKHEVHYLTGNGLTFYFTKSFPQNIFLPCIRQFLLSIYFLTRPHLSCPQTHVLQGRQPHPYFQGLAGVVVVVAGGQSYSITVLPFSWPVTGLGINILFLAKEKCWFKFKEHLIHSQEKDVSYHCGVWLWHLELCSSLWVKLARDGRMEKWRGFESSLTLMNCCINQPWNLNCLCTARYYRPLMLGICVTWRYIHANLLLYRVSQRNGYTL